ncbi:ribonuclease H-like domain-containing protein [Robinsoniella peoriensis]|uniref:ribonuclease H-like domain-containing protein n=1 Tax=Robinsoniella peoriensis TaxID=180332 RepID=UPI0037511463
MITKTTDISIPNVHLIARHYNPADVLFFDIETTGFSPRSSSLYLIGVMYYEHDSWKLRQWLAETESDEPLLLHSFIQFAANYVYLIHFNGDRFDLPYVKAKCETHNQTFLPEQLNSIDIYLKVKPLKKYLKLTHLNQRSLEEYLETDRTDTANGGELIPICREYQKNHDPRLCEQLLWHNHDDLRGLAGLFPLLSYLDLINGRFAITHTEISEESDHTFSLLITASLPCNLPKPISCKLDFGYMTAHGKTCKIQIPGFTGTLKYFFRDYKNYYYLPAEDTAMHKSVASFIDKAYRVPAKAATCFQKKSGSFLPQAAELYVPAFKENYSDPVTYFECTPEFLENTENLLTYIQNLF